MDTIYGTSGDDIITDIDSGDTVHAGAGNDFMVTAEDATFVFEENFGVDVLYAGTGSSIEFNFDRPGDMVLHRNRYDLFIESANGLLMIRDYFRNPTKPSISFTDGSLSAAEALSLVSAGTVNDDNVIIDGATEVPSGSVTLSGGAGSDFIGVAKTDNTTLDPDIIATLDGGTGDDLLMSGATETHVLFGRDSGRDIFFTGTGGDRSSYSIAVDITDTDVTTSDIIISRANGFFSIAIAGSDSALLIPASSIVTNLPLITWTLNVNGSSIDLLDYLGSNGLLAGATSGGSYDGRTSATQEMIFADHGTVISGADDEVISANNDSTVQTLGAFGHDVIYQDGTAHIILDGLQSDYSFSRTQNAVIITNASGNTLTLRSSTGAALPPADITFSDSSVITAIDIVGLLALNSDSNTIYADIDQTINYSPTTETSDQVFYADAPGVTVNGGTGNNFIFGSAATVVIHDSTLGGHDTLTSFQSITVIADDVDDLKFSLDGANLRIENTVTGSILDGIKIGSTYGFPTIEIAITGDTPYSLSPLDLIDRISEDGPTLLLSGATPSYTDNFSHADGSSGDEILTAVDNVYGRWSILNGHGGSDTYTGGLGSEVFVIESLGSGENVVINGTSNNVAGNVGFDILDLSAISSIQSSDLSTDFSRDGNNLVFNASTGGSLVIKDFFETHAQTDYVVAMNNREDLSDAPAVSPQALLLFLHNMAISRSPFSITNVVDEIRFADRTVSYAEIAALFPPHAVPTTGDDVLYADEIGNTIDALAGNDIVYGNADANTLAGNDGDDTLYGDDGDDTLDGGSGSNTLVGGNGNDTFVVSSSTDVVTENVDEGYDIVQSSVSFTLGANIEDLALQGSSNIDATGNNLDNFITGNDGNNVIDGGEGNDIMLGGLGDDTYYVDSASDLIIENEGEGTDTVYVASSIGSDYSAPEGIENVIVLGSDNFDVYGNGANNVITGNSGNNVLNGGDGNDTLAGGDGADTLVGGSGNDSYVLAATDSSDTITELSGEGTDTVQAGFSYTLGSNLENLTLTGSGNIDGTGNSVANIILGNSGNNVLSGGGGNDTLKGSAGNDTYVITASGDSSDTITEYSGEGTDTVQSAITWTLGSNLENLTLTGSSNINGTGNTLDNVLVGNSGNNTLTGGAGNDTLDGGAGTDTLIGGTGDDTYILAASGDTITENTSEGADTVLAGYSYTLGSNLENLVLTGTGNFTGTGNALDNVLTGNSGTNTLTGNAGNDTLKGGAGNDQLLGGVGNDTYVLNRGDGSDAITENDSTAGNTDVARFGESGTAINHDQLWFKMNGSNLEISVIGTSDKFVINSWSSGSARQVESFVASDGYHMTNAQVAGLVSAMSSFSPPASGTTTLDPGTYSTVLSQIAVAWSA